MAAATLIFLTLSIFSTVEAQRRSSNITLGSSLTPTGANSSWSSPSGLYAFGFYTQGNGSAVGVFIAGIPEKTVVWTANRDDPPVPTNVTLVFSGGRLILQRPEDQTTDIAVPSQLASSASMLDTGNFVLYNSDQVVVWQSFDYPTDTILPGQRLLAGKDLVSSVSEIDRSSGSFRLAMQTDGNLVQYPADAPNRSPSDAYYSSGTFQAGNNVSLNLDGDGHLYLLNGTGVNISNIIQGESSPEGKIYRATIDWGGGFRVYSRTLAPNGSWSILWSSVKTECDPLGLCGLNGFCILNDTKADCRCLPGFDFVNPGKWVSGCERTFVAESCKKSSTDGGGSGTNTTSHAMIPLENTLWQDAAYSVLSLITRDDCQAKCLEDCNCEAALFKDGQCRKQRFPLRYGRRVLTDSNLALVKTPMSGPSTTRDPSVPLLPPEETKKDQPSMDILIVGVSLIALSFVVLAISGVLFAYRNHAMVYKKISEQGNVQLGSGVAPKTFTFRELEQVTDGFKEELGRGAFGTVYKGIVPYNQKIVAVKKLEKVLTEGEREFQTEIKVIGKTHHRNLVQLIGYCLDGPNRLLVYEYMSNGSLADFLFKPETRPSWDERIQIALDIARGILYLHEECDTQIIHCDIKPQNILMDGRGCAKISDFGLAKLLRPDQTKTYTGMRGTKGYVAPEWHRRLPITTKADVYSYGVMLFEIICVRRCLDWSLGEEEAVLEEWVYDCFERGELRKLVGEEEVEKTKLERMVKVGLWCVLEEPSLRPSMKKVLLMLEGTVDIPVPPRPYSFISAI
ncbi:hypothetical protein U1Q18_007961 [Sarracenia purpurea var. burkii]